MKVSIQNGVATVDFDRPDRANSLDLAAWHRLRDTFEELDANESVNVVVLTGSGKHFCAGMDLAVLTNFASGVDPTAGEVTEQLRRFIQDIQACVTAIERCAKPVIAAIQGGCIGGGVAIVTACDLRFCTKDAYFVVKEVDFGIVPDIGTLQRLPRIVGTGLTLELAMTGRKFLASEAVLSGLANRSYAEKTVMIEEVSKLAATIAEKDPLVTAGIKAELAFAAGHSVKEGLDSVATRSARILARGGT